MKKSVFLFAMVLLQIKCASTDHYVNYVIDPKVVIPNEYLVQQEESGLVEAPRDIRPMRLKFNDGQSYSEVELPLTAMGHRVIIEHPQKRSDAKNVGAGLVVAAPNKQDFSHKAMEASYMHQGFNQNMNAQPISLAKAQEELKSYFEQSNYSMALEVVLKALDRFPEHIQFLRAKGTLLALLGDKKAATIAYEAAQDLEYDLEVENQLMLIQKEM